jgi:hypothetical protein
MHSLDYHCESELRKAGSNGILKGVLKPSSPASDGATQFNA